MKKKIFAAAVITLLALAFIVCVIKVDVAVITPPGTQVGFSSLNAWFHQLTGVNPGCYAASDVLGWLALALILPFALMGLIQWIRRRDLLKVDGELLTMGGLYIVQGALYLLFDKVVINCRPILMAGETELASSFPSSHTMLSITVLFSIFMVLDRFIQSKPLCTVLRITAVVYSLALITLRLLSGAHWLTDVLGGVLISVAELSWFRAFLPAKKEK